VPTKLYYFSTKKDLLKWCRERGYDLKACEDAWVGPGYYYARSRKHISVHIPALDKRRRKKIGKGPWRHLHDIEEAVSRLAKATRNGVRARAKKLVAKAEKKLREKGGRPRHRPTLQSAARWLLERAAKRSKKQNLVDDEAKRLADYLWDRIPDKYKRGRSRVWTYIAVLALAKQIVKWARQKGVDPRSIDWVSEIDWEQGYQAAKETVRRLLGGTEITDRDVEEYLKWLERSERPPRLDEIDEWELKQLF